MWADFFHLFFFIMYETVIHDKWLLKKNETNCSDWIKYYKHDSTIGIHIT